MIKNKVDQPVIYNSIVIEYLGPKVHRFFGRILLSKFQVVS